jgi:putative flippase GtrA
MPVQTFRYAACGGGNTVLDIVMYFVAYNFILQKQVLYTPVFGPVSPYIAAFLISFAVSFPTGYLLNRYIVFPGSVLKGRIQLFRYFLLVIVCVLMNYVFIKIFVEHFHLYPTVSKILTTVIVVSFSYVTQKNFTFKAQPGGDI